MAANFDHDYIKACRTSYMYFDDRKYVSSIWFTIVKSSANVIERTFDWTFISPSAMYCPGKRTGEYIAHYNEYLPEPVVKGEILPGISAADFAIAIADEAENKNAIFKHWTVTADQSDDSIVPTYPSL